MIALGLSAFFHDSSAVLTRDGRILCAVQEERFSRIKNDASFPAQAIQECLRVSGLSFDDIDVVAFHEKPFLKFERLLETYLKFAPRGFSSFRRAIPLWMSSKLDQKSLILEGLKGCGWKNLRPEHLLFSEHHLSHAASAFYPSPFDDALILVMDGVGEWATTSVSLGRGRTISKVKEIHFPHSLGLLYSAFTVYCGFKVNSGEAKLMGLAPYGKPVFADLILERLVRSFDDGSFELDLSYFDFVALDGMVSKKFHQLFGGAPRVPESALTNREMDLAASIQHVLDLLVLKLTKKLSEQFETRNLCLAGGVALNCVMNAAIQKAGYFDSVWIQPAAGDAGCALGAALLATHAQDAGEASELSPLKNQMGSSCLGGSYTEHEIETELRALGAVYSRPEEDDLLETVAQALSDEASVGWFDGRMEFGPRSLGSRSILGDPRSSKTQIALNLRIKFRESFRPFAPAVLEEKAHEWFDLPVASPYMLMTAQVAAHQRVEISTADSSREGLAQLGVVRSKIPAVTHVDGSARVQTVSRTHSPRFYSLIEKFERLTGVPVLVNTSFNVRGEPIVCRPRDAYRCFMATGLDLLVVGPFLLLKSRQISS